MKQKEDSSTLSTTVNTSAHPTPNLEIDHIRSLDSCIKRNIPNDAIARKIFLAYPTAAFKNIEDTQFDILEEIKNFFKIPFLSIQIVGSSKTRHSLHKENIFTPGTSDLDIAIINQELFLRYMEISAEATNYYSDLTRFPRAHGQPTYNSFYKYMAKGIFRPDLMPKCSEKTNWNNFFGRLSSKHLHLFKSINAGIYSSEYIFELKQSQLIEKYKELKGKTI
ncbi:hypothetical protein [Pseudomonas sp. LRF_L74]|uniref:hypothetical protein n=1 Tax=Pseudomonas sp. LRF_L74 TaxID=3369422 RepID=UPI003F62A4C1